MSCSNCGNQPKAMGYYKPLALETPPFNAADLMVLDENREIRKLTSDDWSKDRHKLILFFPETNTPVCTSELGALNDYIEAFDQYGVDVFTATTDNINQIKDWYESEETLSVTNYKTISSYLLPTRLNIMNNGRVKRASVFIFNDGDVVIQESPLKVGRSLKELLRIAYARSTDSFCAEGWSDIEDGFLT
jgi:alkyl hydroperoxide reductase subunit AhpC